jgi:hypothetical protein
MLILDVVNQYGPFKNTLDLASASVAVAGTLVATVWGRTRWHPTTGVVERLSVVVVAVGVLLLGLADTQLRIEVALAGIVIGLVAGVRYSGLLGRYTYRFATPPDPKGQSNVWYVVTGDALTAAVQERLGAGKLLDPIIADAGYDANAIWDSASRSRNAVRLERWYMLMVIPGTLGLASAAMAFGG